MELVTFQKCHSLGAALQALNFWEQDSQRHELGKTALGFDGTYWLVMVSTDLMARVLPF